jgi:hypothetical protein
MGTAPKPQPLHSLVVAMSRAELARLCQAYGGALADDLKGCAGPDGAALDGPRLLWALSGRESSFGKNMTPRHEPAYDVGGRYANSSEIQQGLALWGRDFACSYGPLQILAVNAKGFTPMELGESPETALAAACAFLRLYVLRHCKAKTLKEICECWNGGHIGATTTPGYVEEVTRHYLAGVTA